VLVYGSIAVMAGRFTVKGRYNDRDISGQYSYTNGVGKATAGVLADSGFAGAHISGN
jgi:hypothetical protein